MRITGHQRSFSLRRVSATITLFASLLCFQSTALAERQETPPQNLEAGLSSSVAMGRGVWLFGGVSFAVRLLPRLSVGGYFDASILNDPMESDCGDVYCARHEYKLGVRARLHALPSFVVDPWLGVGVAERIDVGTATRSGVGVEASVGVDVRLGQVTFGPFGFVDQPLARDDERGGWNGQVGLGLRADVGF